MKLNEIAQLVESEASDAHEMVLAKKLKKKGFTIWAEPAGSAATWPDVGASIEIDETTYNLHIEIKMNKTDPMGSIRAWDFEKGKFKKNERTKEDAYTDLVFEIINKDKGAAKKATGILKEINKHFGGKIKKMWSGMLRPLFKEQKLSKAEIKKKMTSYKNDFSYQITTPKAKDPKVGELIQDHYRSKYKKRKGKNLILFVVGNEMFRMKHPGAMKGKALNTVYEALGVDDIPELPKTFDGEIECRLGPRSSGTMETFLTLRATGLKKLKGTQLS